MSERDPPCICPPAWRAMIASHDQTIAELMAERTANAPVKTEELDLGGAHLRDQSGRPRRR
jgi:hypothetical protein